MNNLQKIASIISGYNPDGYFTSAKDDFYYDKKTQIEKLAQIIATSNTADEVSSLSMNEANQVMNWLETKFNGSNEMWHTFENLGK